MMEFEIVDKPQRIERKRGEWQLLFRSLPYEKAVKLSFDDKREAQRQANSILSSFRRGKGYPFSVHYRLLPGDGKWVVYCWKGKRE